ncbi:MAG TPA: dihydroneopterin aldolase [Candidatus Acetothermia bacterium]|nr:dihydroneopterin aldolase [Candidatus Acetothermia bacterium]
MKYRLTSARIEVCGIEVIGFHGYYDAERTKGNRFSIDLRAEGDFHSSLTSDRLEESIDYSQMVQVVFDVNRAKDNLLIESFADRIANAMLERFPRMQKIAVRVEKLHPYGLGTVRCAAIELEKEREN